MKGLLYVPLLIIIFASCGISEKKYSQLEQTCDSLRKVVVTLNEEIEELKHGEDRLVALAKKSYSEGRYVLASSYIDQLKAKHPESKEISYFDQLKTTLDAKIMEEKANTEKLRKDSVRLANIDNLGIWSISYYVDDYGEATSTAYVWTELTGTFSNSATTDSKLKVGILIDADDIRIQLYEYGKNHPIKGEGSVAFKIRDSNGKDHKITAYNGSRGDTSVRTEDIKTLKQILLNGGEIKFFATAGEYTKSEYKFTISDGDFLENALIKSGIQK